MTDIIHELGKTYKLADCEVTRIDLDTEHFYFIDNAEGKNLYCLSLTHVLDIGAPFPEGLRQYLRMTTIEEQKERLEMTGGRGTKLHDALDKLMHGEVLALAYYPSTYEREALTTFLMVMRFLAPKKFSTEQLVADASLRVAGTLDLKCIVESWKLTALLDPLKYFETDSDGDLQLKERWFDLPSTHKAKVIIDYKFTGRNAYNHKVQVAAYKGMHNKSRKNEAAVSRAFTWRYSGKHKFGFDFQESLLTYRSFKRVYDTALEYMGKFPEPPILKRFPDTIQLIQYKENT